MNHVSIGSILLSGLLLAGGQMLPASLAAPLKKPAVVKKPVEQKKPAPTQKKPPAPTQVVVNKTTIDDSGVRYELTSCKRASESLVCRFFLTNKNEQDIPIEIKTNGTRLIDITGEEYLAKEIQIGSNKSDSGAESVLITQVPIKATITFDAPAASVVTLKVLAIKHTPGTDLKFRDVKIAK